MKRLAAYYFFLFLGMSMYNPYLSLYLSEQGFSTASVGMILSLWALVGVVSQPIMGMWNDRLHRPLRLLFICTVLSAVIGLGFSLFHGYAAILLLAVLFSWFQSSVVPISDTLTVGIVSRDGYPFSKIRLWGALSYSIGAFVTGFVYDRAGGYEKSFLYYFVLSIPVLVLLYIFPKTESAPHRVSLLEQAGEVCRNRPFLIFTGVSLMLILSMSMNGTYLPMYFKQMDFDLGLIGTAVAITALVEVPMFWVSSKLVGRLGRFPMLGLAAACFALKCLLLYVFPNVYVTLAAQALDGICFAFFAGISVEAVSQFAGEKSKATYQTVYAAITYGVSGIVGNAAGGVIVDIWGARILYVILFGIAAASAVLFVTVTREKAQQISPSPAAGRAIS